MRHHRNPGVVTTYGYDGLSRLSAFTRNAAGQITTRTMSDNAYDWTGAYAATRGYAPDGLNRLTTSGPYSLGYDARGNLTSDSLHSYSYSPTNQLTGYSSGGTGATLAYDPLGRLAQTSGSAATGLAYAGDQLIAEYGGSALLRRYVPGPDSADDPIVWYEGSSTSDRRWLIDDERGSVIGITGAGGALMGSPNTYDEYGYPGGSNQGRFQYTGQLWIPEIGLYHYKARTYSPTIGRFMQTDPIGYKSDLDLYAYTSDDPINRTDPTGNDSWLVSRAIYFDGIHIADHEFVVVADKFGGTAKAQFDYGPSGESLTHPGQLVELHGTTTGTRLDDDKAWHGDPSSQAHSEKINASDAAVIASGNKMDSALGTPSAPGGVKYSILPVGPNQANSNTAASAVANGAVQSDHPGAPEVRPPAGSNTPGWDHPFTLPPPRVCDGGTTSGSCN